MVGWHLFDPRLFPRWTSVPFIQSFNFVAEGFVLLAGTVIGLRWARTPITFRAALTYPRRALLLLVINYLLAGFLVVYMELTGYVPSTGAVPPLAESYPAILRLDCQPYLADVLSLFIYLFALTPLYLLVLRHAGQRGLLLFSLALYLTSIFAPDFAAINRQGAFTFNSWQLYFVLGILFGIHYGPVTFAWARHPWHYLGLAVVPFVLCVPWRVALKNAPEWAARQPAYLLDARQPLTLIRTVYILCQLLLVGVLTTRFWSRIADSWAVRWCSALGARSLTVFVCSIVLDYLLKYLLLRWKWQFPATLLALVVELALLTAVAIVPWPLWRRQAGSGGPALAAGRTG